MKPIFIAVICCVLCGVTACVKDRRPQIARLPPATQTGAKTFGCLVNGKAWLPRGSFPFGNFNPVVTYDIFNGVSGLHIHAYHIANSRMVDIRIQGRNIDSAGIYTLGTLRSGADQWATVSDSKGQCKYDGVENGTVCTGTLEITKLEPFERIISGRFSFVISTPGCETLNVTEGRFDLKL